MSAINGISPAQSTARYEGPNRFANHHDAHADHAEVVARWLLRGPLSGLIGLWCLLLVVTWLPGSLMQPLWADHDVFATAARSWDAGLLPYRDVPCNNLPGQIYQFWLVGKLAGWGHSPAFWALNAALLVPLAVTLLVWSRRTFGLLLPGMVGLAAVLAHVAGLDYAQAGQRDGQAAILAMTGLLALLAGPGSSGARVVSALFLATALVIRPQAVLFAPAFLVAIVAEGQRPTRAVAEAVAGWTLALAVFTALWLSPLVLAGVQNDLARCLSVLSYGGSYNQTRPLRVAWEIGLQALQPRYIVIAGLILAFGGPRPAQRRLTLVALTALAGVWFYRPLSPHPHAYLAQPLALTWAVLLAIPAGLALGEGSSRATRRLALVALVLVAGAPAWPRFADPQNLRDIARLARGEPLARGPSAYAVNPDVPAAARYEWHAYSEALDYLRDRLPADTRIANALHFTPAIVGPTGRLSAFPAESIAWLSIVGADDEASYVEALEVMADSVVVWDPGSGPRSEFTDLEAAIRRLYEPAATFGAIEIWQRRGRPWLATTWTGSEAIPDRMAVP